MGADRTEHVGKPLGDGQDRVVPADPGRNRHHAADAGRPRARDDGVELVGEVREIEMAMAVDEHGGLGGPFAILIWLGVFGCACASSLAGST